MTMSQIPGYRAGTWTIDPIHTDISFTARHMMVSKVRGHFKTFSGQIVTGENPTQSSVTAEIDLTSLDTNNAQRDEHIRSADFFDVTSHPTMTFRSTEVRADSGDFTLVGDLTLHGVTRPVELALEVNGFSADPFGGYRSGFTATGQLNRRDFGIDISMPMDGGGVVVSDKIQLALEIEAILDSAAGDVAAEADTDTVAV